MNFIQSIVFFAVLVGAFGYFADAEGGSVAFRYKREAMEYGMTVREYHECVFCHNDKNAIFYFMACINGLSLETRKIHVNCCRKTFDINFCNKALVGRINFKGVCKDPKKFLEVERCTWRKVLNKNSPDLQKFKECKQTIIKKYCTHSK